MPNRLRLATRKANWATLFLMVLGLIIIASIVSNIAEIQLLQRIESGIFVADAEVASHNGRQNSIFLVYIASFVVSGVFFLRWLSWVSRILPELGVDNQKFSPSLAVAWWFCPIMNLFRPYQVMREIWKGSYPNLGTNGLSDWTDAPASPLLGWWWGTWLLSGLGFFPVGFYYDATVGELIAGDILLVASDAISLISLVLVLILMRQITENQSSKYTAHQRLIEATSPAPQNGNPSDSNPEQS